jgi:hypothetical protein
MPSTTSRFRMTRPADNSMTENAPVGEVAACT